MTAALITPVAWGDLPQHPQLAHRLTWAAAHGHAVIGRRRRYAVTLSEIPTADRPAVIRAYLYRCARNAGSPALAREAQYSFGISPTPTTQELRAAAPHYPTFRITTGWSPPLAN